jgi:hypothetical protein
MGRYRSTTPIGYSAERWPIHVYVEDDGTQRYVVVKPSGQAFYSNRNGVLVAPSDATVVEPSSNAGNFLGAAIGGVLGAFLGPFGAAAGAGLGAWLGGEIAKSEESTAGGEQ